MTYPDITPETMTAAWVTAAVTEISVALRTCENISAANDARAKLAVLSQMALTYVKISTLGGSDDE